MMEATGLFVPSGARVFLRTLPPIDRAIRLDDGRRLRLDDMGTGDLGGGEPSQWQMWRGPQGLQCLASLDQTDAWGPLLHVSTSYMGQKRRPSWEDLASIKAAFFGDVDACMILPKEEDYVHGVLNCPSTEVFHLWQIPQRWGIR